MAKPNDRTKEKQARTRKYRVPPQRKSVATTAAEGPSPTSSTENDAESLAVVDDCALEDEAGTSSSNQRRPDKRGRNEFMEPSNSSTVLPAQLSKRICAEPLQVSSAVNSASNEGGSTSRLTVGPCMRRRNVGSSTYNIFDNADYKEEEVPKFYIGKMDAVCRHCKAYLFEAERDIKTKDFTLCCSKGKVSKEYLKMSCPPFLKSILTDPTNENYNHFRRYIRNYNSALSLTSCGLNIMNDVNHPEQPYVFKIHGTVMHNTYNGIEPDQHPTYNQVYFYDPQEALALRKGLNYNRDLKASILETLDQDLRERNAFVKSYKNMMDVEKEMLRKNQQDAIDNLCLVFRMTPTTDLRRWNAPTADEVSAVYTTRLDGRVERDIAVYKRGTGTNYDNTIRMKAFSYYVEPMSYVLFYPDGGLGWGQHLRGGNGHGNGRNGKISQREYYAAKLFKREGEFNPILYGGRLYQQWIVDMKMQIEQDKLNYIRTHQKDLLVESYLGLRDFLNTTAEELELGVGKVVICPSTVYGSDRWYVEQYTDAMALVQKYGRPDLFVTYTCNPKWIEIEENLEPGQCYTERPELVARVFKQRSKAILEDIVKNHCLGRVKAYCYTVEFQKRGLPHVHLLIIFDKDNKLTEPDEIDRIISAELPDPVTEPELFKLITGGMIHGPCIVAPETRACRKNNLDKCSKNYPQKLSQTTAITSQGYPMYRRRAGPTATIFAKGRQITIDNSWVVPHNKHLSQKFQCHINIEACVSIRSVKYIYKYIYKGGDRADMIVRGENLIHYDEVEHYLEGLYLTPPQAAWELFEGKKQDKSHAVTRLAVHLPDNFNVRFEEGDEASAYDAASKKSTHLTAFFNLCETDAFARTLLYEDLPVHYIFEPKYSLWRRRIPNNGNKPVIGRVYSVSPREIERYYLRLLLFHVRGPTGYEDVRTIDGVLYPSYRDAAIALGLVDDDNEWFTCMQEAAAYRMPKQLRTLFSYLLEFNRPANAKAIWEAFKLDMAEDFLRRGYEEEDAIAMALLELETLMNAYRTSLVCFGFQLPREPCHPDLEENRSLAEEADELVASLNVEQKLAFSAITGAVMNSSATQRCFFIDGPGGSGKTYTYRAIQAFLTSRGKSVMALATTGIAADLLEGGTTMHSGLCMPLDLDDSTTVTMKRGCSAYMKLRETDCIIIDEASMMKAAQLKYTSELLKYVTGDKRDFGGKVIVLGGDFRQTLPVMKGCSMTAVLQVTLKKSHLWRKFKTVSLKHNMRAGSHTEFCDWLLDVGDGNLESPNKDFDGFVKIPEQYICDHDSLMEKIYGDALELGDTERISNCIVVAPTNAQANNLNSQALAKIPSQEKVYFSVDSTDCDENEAIIYSTEFLNSQETPGMPFHKLAVKVGAVVMLLRNLNVRAGLLNGTRLLVLDLKPHVIQARILKGSKAGTVVLIPRIICTSSDKSLPYTLKRRQFPVMISFAMTINKAQGQSFDRVGVFLPQPVFSHGQLYVALSRCKNPESLFVSIKHNVPDSSLQDCTVNVVWKSVLSRTSQMSKGHQQLRSTVGMSSVMTENVRPCRSL